jgi:glycosyltransferase involved in cell wall biosynthesis
MSNILVLGVGPLPLDKSDRLFAPGLRTWHIAEILARHKHYVAIGLFEFGDFQTRRKQFQSKREEVGENMSVIKLEYDAKLTPSALSTLQRGNKFSCVISTTDIMNSVIANAELPVPLWLDYNGDPFAEKQLQAKVYNHDASLLDQWRLLCAGLVAGDRFSTVSTPQKYALIGSLGFAGRLNEMTAGEDLVHVVPTCSRAIMESTRYNPVAIKGHMVPERSFVVLWTGGYNTWCDPETLFRGVEIAMRREPSIYYLTTGGEILGLDTQTFRRFRSLVESSDLVNRFCFAGWRPTEQVRSFYEQADVAVNVDAFSYEGELGCRNRIIDWMQFRTPVITSSLCELSRNLERHDLVKTFRLGDAESLAAAILDVAANPAEAHERANRAHLYFEANYSDEKLYAPIVEWAASPRFAGDRSVVSKAGREPQNVAATESRLGRLHQDWISLHSARATAATAQSDGIFRKLLRRFLPENSPPPEA